MQFRALKYPEINLLKIHVRRPSSAALYIGTHGSHYCTRYIYKHMYLTPSQPVNEKDSSLKYACSITIILSPLQRM